ncbi:MAG: hypothetical protein KDI35_01955, partial [Gammaproteobacteria bacterium]|nr:hypothetical protein [Gammaproteobacteria bacterium]
MLVGKQRQICRIPYVCRPSYNNRPFSQESIPVMPHKPDRTAELQALLSERILLLDGAMGTMI